MNRAGSATRAADATARPIFAARFAGSRSLAQSERVSSAAISRRHAARLSRPANMSRVSAASISRTALPAPSPAAENVVHGGE